MAILVWLIFFGGVSVIVNMSTYNYYQRRLEKKLKFLENELAGEEINPKETWIQEMLSANDKFYYGDKRYMNYYPYRELVERMKEKRNIKMKVNVSIIIILLLTFVIGFFFPVSQ